MGFLLMAIGFLICFNALYRTPANARRVDVPAPIKAGSALPMTGSEFAASDGRGD
jgi:hypothetical protein